MEMKQTIVKMQRQMGIILQTQVQSQIRMALRAPKMLLPTQYMKKMSTYIQRGRQLLLVG